MKDVCVIHLVRAQNGIEPFQRFLDSYKENPSDINHDLLIIFKGFESSSDKEPYLKLLTFFQYLSFDFPDIGFDINAYFNAANHYEADYQYFCFLNSFSIIQCSNWLNLLYKHISMPNVGLVGASGSWQSHNSWGSIMKNRKMRIDSFSILGGQGLCKRINQKVGAAWRQFQMLLFFPPFPNYHIRTNAFVISNELLKNIVLPRIKTKMHAYKFESGEKGLTRQIITMGKQVLVIGCDGVGYEMKFWNISKTYWQASQENLLIADNQTLLYQNSNIKQRGFLSFLAWG